MARVLQISDPHVLAPPDKVSGLLDTADLMEKAIDRILADWDKIAPIDAILATGDITERGDVASYALFRRQIDRLPAPSFVIPGNHDLRETMRASFADTAYMPASGKLNWVQDVADLRIIGLDTLIDGFGGGEIDAETASFASSALQSAGERSILIALHHPPFPSGIQFMDDIGLVGIDALEATLRVSPNPTRIICGHVHSTIVANVGGTTAMSSAALCSTFTTDFRPVAPVGFTTQPGGYMVHVLEDGDFRSTAISLAAGDGPFAF